MSTAILIIVVVIAFVFFLTSQKRQSQNNTTPVKRQENNENKISNNTVGSSSKTSSGIGGCADEFINAFEGYLSLCKKHDVVGNCHLGPIKVEQYSIELKFECAIIAIDDKRGEDEFRLIQRLWTQWRDERIDAGDFLDITAEGDRYVRRYFGSEDLHYVFSEADEYVFDDRQAIMSFERTLWMRFGERLEPTVRYIGNALRERWSDIDINVTKNGIIIK